VLDQRALVNNLDKVDNVLVLCLRYIIVYFEELFNIFEFCIILYEALENLFVLLVANFDKILGI
jgi:hypothetical protein